MFPERVHGGVEDALSLLENRDLVRPVGGDDGYALTELGFEAAKLAKSKSLELLQATVDESKPPVPSWFPSPEEIENASSAVWGAEKGFKDFVTKVAEGNAAIRSELIDRMNDVLKRPGRYGDFYDPPHIRSCRLANNQRIRWRHDTDEDGGDHVTFIDVRSREDKRYTRG